MRAFVKEILWNWIAVYVFDRVGNVSHFTEPVNKRKWNLRKTTLALHSREKMNLEVVYKNKKGQFQEILQRNSQRT